MGTTGSVASGKDNNIEMNIADEAPQGNQRSMKRHNSQPAVSIFNQLKLRPKNVDGNVRQSSSLRSSASFDPNITSQIASVNNTMESNHTRQNFELQKVTMDQEIQNLKRKEEKLETENNRLRAELQALNKQCQRLRTERDNALSSSHEATERAIALEQDREKIQRQFKIFRETKEGEIQSLLQAKRQLESNFHRLEAQGMAMVDDHNFSLPDQNIVNLGSAYGDWWAAPESEITSLFDSSSHMRSRYHHLDQQKSSKQLVDVTSLSSESWMTSSNNLSSFLPVSNVFEDHGRSVLRVYLSSTPDCLSDASALLRHPLLKKLEAICQGEGFFLNVVHFGGTAEYEKGEVRAGVGMGGGDERKRWRRVERDIRFAVDQSDVFLAFVGGGTGAFTQAEFDEGLVRGKGRRSTFFCLRNLPANGSCSESGKSLRHVISEQPSKLSTSYTACGEACHFLLVQIVKAVRLIFGIKVSLVEEKGAGGKKATRLKVVDGNDTISCIDEIPIDEILQQRQDDISMSSFNTDNKLQPVGFEKCYDRLDEMVTSPGPVPPLLVSGGSGSGKTLLLSSWTHKLKGRRPDVIVLQHHVTASCSLDAEPVIIFRRLLSQLIRHLPPGTLPPLRSYATYDIARLKETLPRWLEQLSTRLDNRVVLVIDSLDLVKDAPIHFQWLLDPLHVGVRVIISVSVDDCVEIWRNWPTLHLEPLSVGSVRQLVQHHVSELPESMRKELIAQCRTSTTYHPLYVALLCAVANCVCTGETEPSLWQAALRTRDVVELYRLVLRDVETNSDNRQHRNQLKTILQLVVCSRDGLTESELVALATGMQWGRLYAHLRRLLLTLVLRIEAGFYRAHNREIAAIIYDMFVVNKSHERKCLTAMRGCYDGEMTPRAAHMLPWLLHKLEERDALYETVYSPQLLHLMYTRGRTSELVAYLNYLNEEKLATCKLYHDNIRASEQRRRQTDDDDEDEEAKLMRVADMYASLGRFNAELGLMEESVSSLQKSLEIRETSLDPDHPSVPDALHHLAGVYAQWGKSPTAQSLFRHALELVESTVGRDHLRVAQELASLIRVVRKSGGDEAQVDQLQRRMMRIRARNADLTPRGLERLRRRTLTLDELTVDEDSLEIAKALNDLAVMNHMQNNFDNAESFFMRSLNMRRKVVGCDDLDVAQSLYNLALVHAEQKKMKEAIDCMTQSLHIRQGAGWNCSDDVIIATMKGLALLHKKAKDRSAASRLYEDIVKYQRRLVGERNPVYANALLNQAVCESQSGNLEMALPIYEQALDIYRSCHGDDSQQVSQTLRNIALLLYQKGEHEKAAQAYKKSITHEPMLASKYPW